MKRTTSAIAASAALLLLLAGCGAQSTESGDTPSDTDATTTEGTEESSGEQYGCTEAIFDYIAELSYPEAIAIDPASLEIPDGITIATVPTCLVKDESGGVTRYGAFFPGDGAEAIADLGPALEAGGYVQSADYGPYVWWIGGDEPVGAEHQVGVGPQVIGGADVLWLTY